MGTTLEGKQINQTYQGLLKTTDNNEVGSSAKEITDGKGNGTGVFLDNSGNLTANGTVTANALVGDGSQLTNLPVTSVNTQTGSVVLDADDISDTSTTNKFTTSADISKLANIEANADVTDVNNVTTALNSISATELSDITNVGSGSIITSVERTKLAGIEEGAEVNNINSVNGQTGTVTLGLLNLDNVGADGNSGEVLTTDGQGNFTFQPAGGGEGIVTSVNTKTGAVILDTDDIDEGDTNLYYTEARVSANTSVAANTAKVGITTEQANAIVANTAKVGITTQQASDITTNNSKVGITTDQANAIIANTAKNSYPTADATKVGFISVTQAVDLDTLESNVATNNAKVGITPTQASEIAANTLKTGITAQQASDITTNNAKISFDSTSSTKLAGIEDGAEVNVNADWNATTGDAQILNKPTLFSGSYNDLSDKPTIPTNNNELTNGAGYITDGNTGWDNSYGFITASSTDTLTNKSGSNSQWTNDAGYTTNTGTVTNVTSSSTNQLTVATGTTTPELTIVTDAVADAGTALATGDQIHTFVTGQGYIDEAAQTKHTNAIGKAIDFSARVTLDGGVAEGTSAIIKNLQNVM